MNSFRCFGVFPIALPTVKLAIAVNQAGGVGILDQEFCSQQDLEPASKNLHQLLTLNRNPGAVGLRLRADQVAQNPLLTSLCNQPHWLILCHWTLSSLQQAIAALPAAPSRQLLLEVLSVEQVKAVAAQSLQFAGWVARGHESGGWVGEDSALILTQKLLRTSTQPVYIQGGMGIHTAAACRAAGAAGVVLDDQLWLMPESPLSQAAQAHLQRLNGQEATVIGERFQAGCRVLSRPGSKVINTLQRLANQIEIEEGNSTLKSQAWQQQAQQWLGWDQPETLAWPMGQAVGLAADLHTRYGTTSRLVQALLQASVDQVELAKTIKLFVPGAPLAQSHGTKYPIVQGPMTRVSDQASFAQAIAQAGGLPMLALALMRGSQVRDLLQQAKTLMPDQPWGIGILGFVPQALRQEQLAVVLEIKPPFALIAGGRPDQAAHLEAAGIATYLHVPTPGLLKLFLEQGARRFVFEGRECGGHVGPLSSFVLWETMIATLLQAVPDGAESEIHVLFAGGIHDSCSAAMVSVMAAPLAARGMKVGTLMGTAYIFTQEAVSTGAITSGFQAQVLACQHTINLETGPGHASRCAVTPFAQEFYDTRRRLIAADRSPDEIKETLENLTLGRLRVASKGVKRDETGELVTVNPDQQVKDGMYMLGQVATLRGEVCTLAQLHQEVSEMSTDWINQLNVNPELNVSPEPKAYPASDIAMIGLSTLLPKAQYPEQFWDNLLRQVNAITEIPSSRWDWRLYYDPNRHARDKVYSKWGGFLDDVPFDPLKFGIPPKSLKSIEPLQLLTLEAVRRALENAGYAERPFDRENTSVILGAGGGIADLGQQYATRSELPRFVGEVPESSRERLPEWTEESFPGLLLNVIAGRVTNRFDFGGANFTVDAACASSLAAIDAAVKELETGRCNVAIAGGVDTCQSPFAYLCFSKTQALSPQGQARTFDQNADGIVISEGIAIVVLKRLADAERDGDRIYGVIKAVASSSDGKALGLTAPLPTGQLRAVNRAYQRAGFSPNTLALYEAHGTGTVAGDRAELETLLRTLVTHQAAAKSCAIGSVKTLVGHTKSSAGVVGLVKMALALHHKVLPPHSGVEQPLEAIHDPASPVYLLKQAHPWLKHPDYPRRGAVSAFGFGGTNFHAVLEEYLGEPEAKQSPGGECWPCELFLWRAANRETLIQSLQNLQQDLQAGAEPPLRDLSYSIIQQAQLCSDLPVDLPVCLTLVAESLLHLNTSLTQVLNHLHQPNSIPLPLHIQLNWQTATVQESIAFLFPGQGSQYPDMAREIALYFPVMRQALEFADQSLRQHLPQRLSQWIYPPSPYSDLDDERNHQALMNTHIAQPAIGTVEMGFLKLADQLGLQADMVAGHSYGEYAALYAAGVLSPADLLNLSEIRGRVMATACQEVPGAMAVVQATRVEVLNHLKGFAGVVIANHNAPLQSVISGSRSAVEAVVNSLHGTDIKARLLPVAGAFHTCLVATAQVPLAEAIAATEIQLPQIPVYANSTAQPYTADVNSIRSQLSKHLLASVEYVQQIEAMYQDGARIFIELGPKSVLTKLTSQILADKPHLAVSLDGNGGGLRGYLNALGTLITQGVQVNLTALFDHRTVQPLDLSRLVASTQKPPLSKTAWLLNGGGIRPQTETVGYAGKLPPFNQDNQPTLQLIPAQLNAQPITPALGEPPEQSLAPAPAQPVPQLQSTSPVKLMNHSTVNHSNNGMSHQAKTQAPVPSTNPAAFSTVPQPQTPQPMQTFQPHHLDVSVTALSESERLRAYQAYQETMRQFLSLQEQVMHQFLAGNQSQLSMPPMMPPTLRAPSLGEGQQEHALNVPRASRSEHPSPTVHSSPSGNQPEDNGQPQLPQEFPPVFHSPINSQAFSTPHSGIHYTAPTNGHAAQPQVLGSTHTFLEAQPVEPEVKLDFEPDFKPVVQQPIIQQPIVQQPKVQATEPQQEETSSLSSTLGLNPAELTQTLVNLVSDRTGYPPEMLGLDQDLEAELGIDSIKRVEILGALQKQLPEPFASGIQAQMDQLTRVKSLKHWVTQVLGSAPVPLPVTPPMVQSALSSVPQHVTAPIPQPEVPPANQHAPTLPDQTELIQVLVNLVSDRTGYPPEMLGLDQDLEAELGIDSIKRVEILGALQKQLPEPFASGIQAQMDQLTRVKSLNSLAQIVGAIATPVLVGEKHGLGKSPW